MSLSGFFARLFRRRRPLGAEAFTAHFAKAYRKAGLNVTVVEPLHLKVGNATAENRLECFLENAWQAHCSQPSLLSELTERFTETTLTGLNPPPLSADRIVPVIKHAGYAAEMREALAAAGTDRELPTFHEEILCEGLCILYVHDDPNGMRYLDEKALLDLTGEADVRALAIRNLPRVTGPVEITGQDTLWMVTCGGDYEASLILLESLWDDPRLEVPGNPVFAIPARDMLFITGSGDSGMVSRLAEITESLHAGANYAVSPKLYMRTDQGIEPL